MSAPTGKEQKYDRQLRLWAAAGQDALENSHVCVIGANAAGCELAKNLVLPGVGRVTIIDDRQVSPLDVECNFFVTSDDIGKPRAETAVVYLKELNPEVRFDSASLDLASDAAIASLGPSFWQQFSVVVASALAPSLIQPLSAVLWSHGVPLVLIDSAAFYASLRLVLSEHTIVETHPDSLADLRLDAPWPELQQRALSLALSTLSEPDFEHVPFVVLLLHFVEVWKKAHAGVGPSSHQERNEFKLLINAARRRGDEENFDEAVAAVWRLSQTSRVPRHIEQLFDSPKARTASADSPPFWILVAALARFVASDPQHLLPLPGILPDMKADTRGYIELQTVYRQKAETDLARFRSLVSEIDLRGRVTSEDCSTFCKNASFLKVFCGQPITNTPLPLTLDDDAKSNFVIYAAINAVKRYTETTPLHWTGSIPPELESLAVRFFDQLGLSPPTQAPTLQEVLAELLRAGAGELHNISALIGGIGAQEVIKVLAHQYVPLDNTLIYDGIRSVTASFTL